MKLAKIVFLKELREAIRDYRTLGAAFSYALFGPLVLYFALDAISESQTDKIDLEVAVSQAEEMPDIMALFAREDVNIVTTSETAVLVEPGKDYADRRQRGAAGRIQITSDHSDNQQRAIAMRVDQLIRRYSQDIASARLTARGVTPEVITPIQVTQFDTSEAGARGKSILNMLLIFFAMAPFFASMSFAVDTLAGERERKSLHVLLAQPINAMELIMGKWAVAALFGVVGTALTVIVGFIVLRASPLADLGISLILDWQTAAMALLILLPLIAVATAMQILLSIYAKSYKEGQTYLTLLSFAPAMIGLTTSLGNTDDGMGELPIYAELSALENLMMGLQSGMSTVSLAISAVITLTCLVLVARRLHDDKLITDG